VRSRSNGGKQIGSPRVPGVFGDGAGGGAAPRWMPAVTFPRSRATEKRRTGCGRGRRTRGLGRRRLSFPGATMNDDWRRATASGPVLLRVLWCKSARKAVGSYGGWRRSEVRRILMSGPSVPNIIVGSGRAVAELRREISL
jgi:hypothetical protein